MKASDVTRSLCINLARRADRWQQMQKMVASVDWPFPPLERFEALSGTAVPPPDWFPAQPGAWGCWLSHVRVWELTLAYGWESTLIIEDDAEPVPDFNQRIREFMEHVPDDWGQIWLGTEILIDHDLPSRMALINPYVVRVAGVHRTTCYIQRRQMLADLYPFIVSGLGKMRSEVPTHIDLQMNPFQHKTKWRMYMPRGAVFGQAADLSDITEKPEHYGTHDDVVRPW